jgi:hypothetical protein
MTVKLLIEDQGRLAAMMGSILDAYSSKDVSREDAVEMLARIWRASDDWVEADHYMRPGTIAAWRGEIISRLAASKRSV